MRNSVFHKKHIAALVLFFVVNNIQTMDLSKELSKKDDAKCRRIGRYLALTECKDSIEQKKRQDFEKNSDKRVQRALQYKNATIGAMDFIKNIPKLKISEIFP